MRWAAEWAARFSRSCGQALMRIFVSGILAGKKTGDVGGDHEPVILAGEKLADGAFFFRLPILHGNDAGPVFFPIVGTQNAEVVALAIHAEQVNGLASGQVLVQNGIQPAAADLDGAQRFFRGIFRHSGAAQMIAFARAHDVKSGGAFVLTDGAFHHEVLRPPGAEQARDAGIGINGNSAPAFAIKKIGVGNLHGMERARLDIKTARLRQQGLRDDVLAELRITEFEALPIHLGHAGFAV
jgi:hypothetical protein